MVGRFPEHATAIPLSSATLKEAIESAIRAGDYKVARDLFRITPGQ